MIRTIIIIISFFTISCSTIKFDDDEYIEANAYVNEQGYKYWYEVDSIHIQNPVIVCSTKGGCFVMSYETLSQYNGKQNFFLDRPDVYLYQNSYGFGMYNNLSNNALDVVTHCAGMSVLNKEIKCIKRIYKLKRTPDYFILFLIRGDYYSKEFNLLYDAVSKEGIFPPLLFKDKKYYFYKMAIPICKK